MPACKRRWGCRYHGPGQAAGDPSIVDIAQLRGAFERALGVLRTGDAALAEKLCREGLAAFPGEPNLTALLGAALNRQGRGAEAEPMLSRLAADEPDYAKGHEELGRSLLQLGRADEAAACFRRALALDPKLTAARLSLVHALSEAEQPLEAQAAMQEFLLADPAREKIAEAAVHQRAGRLEQAEAIYRELLAEDPRNVEALRLLALIALQTEHYGQAEQLLARAVEIAPDYLAAWIDLSRVRLEKLDLPGARIAVERAALLNPRSANVQIHVANVEARSNRHDAAIAAYRRAIEANPASAPAFVGLGNVLKTVGRHEEAVEAYRRAAALRPGYSEAWWSLSNLKTFRFTDAELEAMQAEHARPGLADEARVQFSFAIAKALEDRGEHARAFELYVEGNRTRRRLESYDPVQTEVLNERIRTVFDAGFLARHAAAGDPDPAPIFVVGLPRSGSTLLEQILASHSQVDATHELPEVGRIILGIRRDRGRRAYPEAVLEFSDAELTALGRAYLDSTRQYRRGAPRFVDKNPNNFPSLGLLAVALPNARFINARRHPLDACWSCYRQLFARGQPFTYDLTELGEYYLEYDRMMAHWHAVMPGRVLDVDYEQVVADLEGQARRLLDFCGLPWEDACLRFHETERPIRTASSEQVRRPIYDSSIGAWRKCERELAPLIEVLAPVLQRYGPDSALPLSSA
ncbi:MAG TPA: sulfotransferase [Steroidobacteraceae bacterium]|nr:sulfotransferase [Steroidobacteraceae bacterium]